MQPSVPTISSHTKTKFNIEGQEYTAILFHSCMDPLFPEIVGNSIFLSKAYHAALTAAPPEKMKFHYVRLDYNDELAGMLCFQIEDFNPQSELG